MLATLTVPVTVEDTRGGGLVVAKKIDIGSFMVAERDGVILLLHSSRSIGLIHEEYVDEFISRNGLEHRSRFRFEVDGGQRFICLEGTCWGLDVLDSYGINWHFIYAGENKPLVARIEGTDWYLVVSPVIRG